MYGTILVALELHSRLTRRRKLGGLGRLASGFGAARESGVVVALMQRDSSLHMASHMYRPLGTAPQARKKNGLARGIFLGVITG